MAEITSQGISLSAGSNPTVTYNIVLAGRSRPNNSQMTYTFTVKSSLSSGGFLEIGSLDGKITVNGVGADFTIKKRNIYWYSSELKTNTVTVTCPSTSGGSSQPVAFSATSDQFSSSGIISRSDLTVTSLPMTVTACAPPINIMTPDMPFEYTTSWQLSAAGGTNNSVTGYDIQYSTRPNGGIFSSWNDFKSISTTKTKYTPDDPLKLDLSSVTPRGYDVKIRVRTKGTAGPEYYSSWSETGHITRNRLPSTPPYITPSTVEYRQGDSITLSWGAASDADSGNGALEGYRLQYSTDDETWTDLLKTASTTTTVIPVQAENGGSIRYRVCAYDKLGASGDYAATAAIRRLDATKVYVDVDNEHREAYFYYARNDSALPCVVYVGIWNEAVPLPNLGSIPLFAYLTDGDENALVDHEGNKLILKGIWWANG